MVAVRHRGREGIFEVAKSLAWMLAGAVIMTAGVAHAQSSVAPVTDAGELPWFQRFTAAEGSPSSATAPSIAPSWDLNQRWGVTVDLREAERIQRGPEGVTRDETAVGAYYQFTPRVRVGGEVSVGAAQRVTPVDPRRNEDEPEAGVRLESAFRF
jgi:hypothetical protein